MEPKQQRNALESMQVRTEFDTVQAQLGLEVKSRAFCRFPWAGNAKLVDLTYPCDAKLF